MKNIVLWKPVESPSEVQIQRPRVGRGGAPGLGHPGAGNGRRGWPSGPETGVLACDYGVRDRDGEGVPCVRTSVGPRGDGNQKNKETDAPATCEGSRVVSIPVFQLRALPRFRRGTLDGVRGAVGSILESLSNSFGRPTKLLYTTMQVPFRNLTR